MICSVSYLHFRFTKICEFFYKTPDAQPIFGVSLGLSLQRSRCHDDVALTLVVRDCIDYLQEHGLSNDQIYKVDAVKTKVQHLKTIYNNREPSSIEDFDVQTACGLLKLFFKYDIQTTIVRSNQPCLIESKSIFPTENFPNRF